MGNEIEDLRQELENMFTWFLLKDPPEVTAQVTTPRRAADHFLARFMSWHKYYGSYDHKVVGDTSGESIKIDSMLIK